MSKSRRRGRGRGRRSLAASRNSGIDNVVAQEKAAADREFALMDHVYAFTVDGLRTSDKAISNAGNLGIRNVLFKTGDDVILNSPYDGTHDIWIGHISQIRANQDRTEAIAKVRWYWSRNDVAAYIKSFKPENYSPYERILSDDYDYVAPYAFQGRLSCIVRSKSRSSPHLDKDPMHFCPRLDCRTWYHSSCLPHLNAVDVVAPPSTRGIRLLAVDPDSEAPFVLFGHFCEPESRDLVPESTEQMTVHEVLELWGRHRSILSHLPPSLLTIAQSPIVRCSGASNGWAIGNVADVVLARRFVYAAIEHDGAPEASEKWYELLKRERARQEDLFWLTQGRTIDVDIAMNCERDHEIHQPGGHELWGGLWDGLQTGTAGEGISTQPDEVTALEGLCEDLAQFDLLASVYVPYWERRAREFEAAAELLSGPAFVCPQCRSAI
ncbi:hypothetical protein DICSQDRAFT_162264 [Dichomitus squalens LYAD-421 SS1]|uniref:BAH domain-containing protein n=1 Tax=Dichomitus squalens (strain LYAD-421) TaxID=732165 RepID=R7SVD2_DICSQ|nr:uncharacterized protein DICSQDRAFT_162264 [Dichomitus squalens LYAD-421 SS1]EJF59878.1 hypothetical protein DICSQDRAFT_162264 [Dichomitus squalens LYAD-421 SS1]